MTRPEVDPDAGRSPTQRMDSPDGQPGKPTHILIGFPDEGVNARARLLWEEDPAVCAQIAATAPFQVQCHHAIYSGSEIAAVTPMLPCIPVQTATSDIEVGDVAYAYLLAADHYGVSQDFAEICWFYDIDARPSMFNGPAQVSVFARLEEADEFFTVCRRMRLEGAKQIRIDL